MCDIVNNLLGFTNVKEYLPLRNCIDDQNNDNIINEPQDILEEYVEDDDDNNNEFVHIFCILPSSAIAPAQLGS